MKSQVPRLPVRIALKIALKSTRLLALCSVAHLQAESASKQQIADFLNTPPQIREMVVECNWYAHAVGTTNITWIALCWQTNAYIIRSSKQQTGLYDVFDTNRDTMITLRTNDTYFVVSNYKLLGVHTEQVQDLQNSGPQDIVVPKVRGQETLAAQALTLGIPAPLGSFSISNGTFNFADPDTSRTLFGSMDVNRDDLAEGFSMVNRVDPGPKLQGAVVVPMFVKFAYGGELGAAWFPREIVREVELEGVRRASCRLVTHRMVLGTVPLSEFYPERFLPSVTSAKVVTSNGISFLTLGATTKPVMDLKDPRAKGIPAPTRGQRLLYGALVVVLVLVPLALSVIHRRKPER